MSTDERSVDDVRHIKNIEETDDEIIITYGKSEEVEDMPEEVEEERFSKAEVVRRANDMQAEAVDDRRVSMSVSSENPVERQFGQEVIVHSENTLDLKFARSGNMPLLLDHDPERQIGVVESVSLDSSARRLRATARFSRSQLAEEVYRDVIDGIRSNVSIGYRVRKMERDADRADLYRVTDAELLEVSIVSLPADQSVGTNRSIEVPDEAEIKTIVKEVKMTDEINMDQVRADAAAERSKEISEILSLAARHNQRGFADQAIREGASLAQFRGALLDKIADKPLDVADVDMTQKSSANILL